MMPWQDGNHLAIMSEISSTLPLHIILLKFFYQFGVLFIENVPA